MADRIYTEKQQYVLDHLWEYKGDVMAAAKAAGYANPGEAVKALRKELIEMAEEALARIAPKAVLSIEQVMDSETPILGAQDKMKAAQMVLDRTNPKREVVDLNTSKGSIFILPNKRPLSDVDEQD